MRRTQLEIHDAPLGEVPGIGLAGEVDIAVGKQVEAALDAGVRASAGAFVLDLSELEFLDSSGVSLIMRARALLGREERELVLVCLIDRAHRNSVEPCRSISQASSIRHRLRCSSSS